MNAQDNVYLEDGLLRYDEYEEMDVSYGKGLEHMLAHDPITSEQMAKDVRMEKLLRLILDEAIDVKTTDVQISFLTNEVIVRYRIDGKMLNFRRVDPRAFEPLSARIKYISRLSFNETRVPQDGRFSHEYGGDIYDVRVSTIPTNKGENISMRLLYNKELNTDLAELNINDRVLEKYRKVIKSREGLVLLTGPTGSGKTTTLYTTIGELLLMYGGTKNIMTIEDPIEYAIDGIVQSQVNRIREYHFADGLRALLRQNPDIILVGEIRDKETAETATRASNTGHLVFSTLHASDAVSTALVMKQLGVEPHNIANTLKIVLNQRLTGKLCPHCSKRRLATVDERRVFPNVSTVRELNEGGCDLCDYKGTNGLVLVIEMLEVTETFRDMIYKDMTGSEIRKELSGHPSYYSLQEDLEYHLLNGHITMSDAIHLSMKDVEEKEDRQEKDAGKEREKEKEGDV